MEVSVSPFCCLLGCLEVLTPLGWECSTAGISAAGWGGKGMGAVPVPGTGAEMGWEPDPSLGARAASSWSIQLLGHPDVRAPGVGHPWHLGPLLPVFPFCA